MRRISLTLTLSLSLLPFLIPGVKSCYKLALIKEEEEEAKKKSDPRPDSRTEELSGYYCCFYILEYYYQVARSIEPWILSESFKERNPKYSVFHAMSRKVCHVNLLTDEER